MIRPYKVTSGPTVEPVTLQEIKDNLGVVVSDDDTILTALITAAREHIENTINRKLIDQTITFTLPDFDCLGGRSIVLPMSPVLGVISITYTDSDGNEDTVLDSGKYVLRDTEVPPEVVLLKSESWPDTYYDSIDAVTVTITCGYGSTASDVPEALKTAIILYAKKLYDQEVQDGKYIDDAVAALTNKYIAWWA